MRIEDEDGDGRHDDGKIFQKEVAFCMVMGEGRREMGDGRENGVGHRR